MQFVTIMIMMGMCKADLTQHAAAEAGPRTYGIYFHLPRSFIPRARTLGIPDPIMCER